MSEERFLELLQQLLTMVDPEDPCSVACMKTILINIQSLACQSGKASPLTTNMMNVAQIRCNDLIMKREHFAGVPGDYLQNKHKRARLRMILVPSC